MSPTALSPLFDLGLRRRRPPWRHCDLMCHSYDISLQGNKDSYYINSREIPQKQDIFTYKNNTVPTLEK